MSNKQYVEKVAAKNRGFDPRQLLGGLRGTQYAVTSQYAYR